jgi:Holliday junction resolvase RusA-like endonuclease
VKLYRRAQEPDRDNIHKLTMDAGNKILRKDDKLIKKSLVEKIEKDNEKPRIELYFSPL